MVKSMLDRNTAMLGLFGCQERQRLSQRVLDCITVLRATSDVDALIIVCGWCVEAYNDLAMFDKGYGLVANRIYSN